MPIAGYICTANAAAVAVLSEEERRQGCALLDCGAETTTLSLYKDGYFASMITIPLGGNNITRDICSLHVKVDEEGLSTPDRRNDYGRLGYEGLLFRFYRREN